MKVFEVTARVDNGCNAYEAKYYIYSESASEAHLTVKKYINNLDAATWGTILRVHEVLPRPGFIFDQHYKLI